MYWIPKTYNILNNINVFSLFFVVFLLFYMKKLICIALYAIILDDMIVAFLRYMANNTGLSTCTLCSAGFFCVPGEAPRVCKEGEQTFNYLS